MLPIPSIRRAFALFLVAALALAACASESSSDWDETKRWVRDAFPGIPTTTVGALHERLDDPERGRPILLDARAPEEYAVSHLEGALSSPDVESALAVLATVERDAPIVVYCSVGYRSARLTGELRGRGFTDAFNLEGSIFEWANTGLPVFRDGRQVAEVHPFDREWGRLLDRQVWPSDW